MTAGDGASGGSGDEGESGDEGGPDRPPRRADEPDRPPRPTEAPIRWYLHARHPLVVASRDVLTSVVLVFLIGLTLFAVSGVWPPMVAVESGSMEPNMEQGDLVILVEADRFTSERADARGVVTQSSAADTNHDRFGRSGSVIVYRPHGVDGSPVRGSPIVHRVAMRVEEGENWVERADPQYLGSVESCEDVHDDVCPAPHDGYVTRGDYNDEYDQIPEYQSTVVRPAWIEGRAVAGIPYLGCVRLELSDAPDCSDER